MIRQNEPDPGDYFEREIECSHCDQLTTQPEKINGEWVCRACFYELEQVQEVIESEERDWRQNPTPDEEAAAEIWRRDYENRRDAEMKESA